MNLRNKVILIFLIMIFACDVSKEPIDRLLRNHKLIKNHCSKLGLSAREYFCVVLSELENNYNYLDKLDNFRAANCFDASVGLTQIKVSTFIWIEDNYSNLYITKSDNFEELITKISEDTLNLIYSMYYCKIISDLFYKIFEKQPTIEQLGSYYARGIDYGRDHLDSTYINIVGSKAREFFYSQLYLIEFPKN